MNALARGKTKGTHTLAAINCGQPLASNLANGGDLTRKQAQRIFNGTVETEWPGGAEAGIRAWEASKDGRN